MKRLGQAHIMGWGSHPCRAASCRVGPLPPPLHTGTTPQEGTDRSECAFVCRLHSRCYTAPTGPTHSSHLNTHARKQNTALIVKPLLMCNLVYALGMALEHLSSPAFKSEAIQYRGCKCKNELFFVSFMPCARYTYRFRSSILFSLFIHFVCVWKHAH